jgi:hypothetical protein
VRWADTRTIEPVRRWPARGFTRCEKDPRPARLRQERLNVGNPPNVVYDHQRCLLVKQRPITIGALDFGFRSIGFVFQRPAHLLHTCRYAYGDVLAHCGPGDSVRERLLNHLIVAQRLCQDGFSNAAHAAEGGQGNRRPRFIYKNCVSQMLK